MAVRSVNEGSNLVDPFIDDLSVSFIPRAINSKAHLLNPKSPIFNSILRARVSSSPDKLLKLGKTILEGNMDHLQADNSNVVNTENERGCREKRPGLGIQQAKFTMRPIPSQQAESLESSFDFSKSDPVEFFADFERREKARKEVLRLNGQPLYDFDPNQPVAPRSRRPSLLGTTATYKHRSYPGCSLAKETFDNDVPSPTHNDVLCDYNFMDDSPGGKVSDSKSVTTSEVTQLCDLLPLVEGLDEDGVQNLLHEKLKIKDVDIGKIVLPEWRVPLPDSVFNLSGDSRRVKSRNQTSPGKLKSPLASISSLNRHIAKRTPSKDPFSPLHIDLSPAEAVDPERRVDLAEQSDQVDARGQFRRSPAHVVAKFAASGEDASVSVVNDTGPTSEPIEKEGVVGHVAHIGNGVNSLELKNPPVHGEENIAVSSEDFLLSASMAVGPTSETEIQEDEVVAAQFPVRQFNFEGLDMENPSSFGVDNGMQGSSNTENIPVKAPAKKGGRRSKRRIEKKGELEAPSEAVISEKTVKEGVETITSESDEETKSKRRKVDGAQRGRSKRDSQQRRFSLYNAGTKWEGGVRRSSRIRMRPLEYWKGERFLYGRVNESLVTVIGVKYASPTTDAKTPKIKMKSFVSDNDKDLLKFYSLY